MSVTLPANTDCTETTLGTANVFTQFIVPAGAGNKKFTIFADNEAYLCFNGSDGGTRSTEGRVPIKANTFLELDRMVKDFYLAGVSDSALVRVVTGDVRVGAS